MPGDDSIPTSPVRGAEPPPQPVQTEGVGTFSILVFELYFLFLGIGTIYVLWTIWPYAGAPAIVRVFGFPIDFKNDIDARLLAIAVLSGLLGALVHAITSLTTYLGNREFYGSWVPWYVLRPMIGMSLGLLFYLIVRGGVVNASGANAVNPFGVAAISGFAGLFSKQTVDKMRDTFEHLFGVTGDKDRKDPLTPRPGAAADTGTRQVPPGETPGR